MTAWSNESFPQHEAAVNVYGESDLEQFFDGRPRTLLPWPRAPRMKHAPLVPAGAIATLLEGPPLLVDVDPRVLFATQNWVIAEHCRYYQTGLWERTGRTAQDMDQRANRYPLIYVDTRNNPVILAGHHRSMVALLEGRFVRARILRNHPSGAAAVLPLLLAGPPPPMDNVVVDDPRQAAALVAAGTTTVVPDLGVAERTLISLGLVPEVIRDRMSVAGGGGVLATE